jgi:receptor protein-tyrosine kinase
VQRRVWGSLRRAWWIPVLATILAGAAALGTCLLLPQQYTAHTQLFVSASDTSGSADIFEGTQLSQQRVSSYTQLLNGEELARRLVDRLDLNVTPTELSDQIAAEAQPDSVLIDVDVTDASPQQAQRIARAVTTTFPGMVAELEAAKAGSSPVAVSVVTQPEVPTRPSSPDTVRAVLLASFFGLALGIGGVVLRDRLDRSVRDPQEAEEIAGAPVVGTVLRDRMIEKQHVLGRGAVALVDEDYRQIRTNLQFVSVDQPPRIIMVSSAVPSEGKTTLVVNLARVLADAGRNVMVVEADLRRPKVIEYLGLVAGAGLTNVLAGTAEISDVVQVFGRGRFAVLGAGAAAPNPGELLASSAMSNLLQKLGGDHDVVLVDAAPMLSVADASGLAPLVDGVLLSVRYGETTSDQLRQAATKLRRVGASVLGVVLNIVPPSADIGDGRSYGYERT